MARKGCTSPLVPTTSMTICNRGTDFFDSELRLSHIVDLAKDWSSHNSGATDALISISTSTVPSFCIFTRLVVSC